MNRVALGFAPPAALRARVAAVAVCRRRSRGLRLVRCSSAAARGDDAAGIGADRDAGIGSGADRGIGAGKQPGSGAGKVPGETSGAVEGSAPADSAPGAAPRREELDSVKRIPVSMVDASGAMQLDDGSLAATVSFVPRRLVKRGREKGRFDVETLKRQLASGFDSGRGAAIVLILLFGVWYYSSTVFNVYNKQVLEVFPFPVTCTLVQFVVASVVMSSLWLARVKAPPKFNGFMLRAAAPLAVLHAAGFLLTNMSLGKVSVAFTHTVKSTEPFFSVALTPSILGDIPTWGILGSLFPIVAGVGLASLTEMSFNWIGFLAAVGSNVALQSRNILSKKLMDHGDRESTDKPKKPQRKGAKPLDMSAEEEEALLSLDNINLFSTMTILAFFILIPVCLLWEGMPLLSGVAAPAVTGMSSAKLYRKLALGGICRCIDVLSSYMILRRVSPVTHSVGNCVKRAVVIAVSIIFFKTKMSIPNIAGTLLALTGVCIYSLIVSACKQNTFGPDSPFCKPIYESEMELTEGSGI